MIPKYFYRVHVMIDKHLDPDADADAHLTFDFQDGVKAIKFANTAYNACDLYKVWVDIVENEVTTTNSPDWRE